MAPLRVIANRFAVGNGAALVAGLAEPSPACRQRIGLCQQIERRFVRVVDGATRFQSHFLKFFTYVRGGVDPNSIDAFANGGQRKARVWAAIEYADNVDVRELVARHLDELLKKRCAQISRRSWGTLENQRCSGLSRGTHRRAHMAGAVKDDARWIWRWFHDAKLP